MKKSQDMLQKIAALQKQLAAAKKMERQADERKFVQLAKESGIFALPHDLLVSEFRRITSKHAPASSPSVGASQDGGAA